MIIYKFKVTITYPNRLTFRRLETFSLFFNNLKILTQNLINDNLKYSLPQQLFSCNLLTEIILNIISYDKLCFN